MKATNIIGLIGLGELGLAVAGRLLVAGHTVAGYRRGNPDSFASMGGLPQSSAAATAACSQPLILLLPTDEALLEVMQAITPALKPEQVVICLGTHRASAKASAAQIATNAGATLLDGEVSGTPAMMKMGQASVLLAGDADAVTQVVPVVNAFASATSYVGAFGKATKMKLITNYLVGVHTFAAAEALRMADQLGLDLPSTVAVLKTSAASSTMLAIRGPMMAAGQFASGHMPAFNRYFSLLRDALEGAEKGERPLLDLTESVFRDAVEKGYGDRDIAGIFESLSVYRSVQSTSKPCT
jgi:3-hydroxyisobutyrate dehydrogenase